MSTDIDEQLIGQLVISDDAAASNLPTILKSIYAADRLKEFQEAVQRYSTVKKTNFEDICIHNYQALFQCIDWQQKFRQELIIMTTNISKLKTKLSECAETMLEKRSERLNLLKMQMNLSKCISACESSLRAFNLAQLAALHILDRKFEDALRQLDALNIQLRLVEQFSFSQQLSI